MLIADALKRIREVVVEPDLAQVYTTAAEKMCRQTGALLADGPATGTRTAGTEGWPPSEGSGRFVIGRARDGVGGVDVTLREDGSGSLRCNDRHLVYGAAIHLLEDLPSRDVRMLANGHHLAAAFAVNRSCYDIFLTQEARVQHRLDREAYIERLAASGFTHIEVNGLAWPMAIETGPKGEIYPMFYTYCPALDQFVTSSLNKGLYPDYYLDANLAYLKSNAALARKYGLVPGLVSFEPRSVPEEFFARYPMLRGARVDHPFRSFKPRFTMTIAHPRVLEHYAEMLNRMFDEVPDLGFMSVWSNDSGSGFEHTTSLYVGRNGGPYMIREWKGAEEIARVAGEHAVRFLRTLLDAGQSRNPGFRVLIRMEPFRGEFDTVWNGLGGGLDVETTSLVARGWAMPYRHPRYPDSDALNGGFVHQLGFEPGEKTMTEDLRGRGSEAHFYFAAGPHQMFAPLIGLPYPKLTWQRLKLLHDHGVSSLAQIGGTAPPGLVPWNANHEILRRFQFDPGMDADAEIRALAKAWAGPTFGDDLADAWSEAEDAILAYPNVCTLYSTIGFTWYRLWARPLVPNIEAIPAAERAYYERFMCTMPHNPNNVDLSRDVLFRIVPVDRCATNVSRIDANVWPPLDAAIARLCRIEARADETLGPSNVIRDQRVRLQALRCWIMTQRNVAAWIASVYGYMEATSDETRKAARAELGDAIDSEIANSRALQAVIDSGVEFMATSGQGESPLMHGRNLRALLDTRIALMERRRDDEPFIDHKYMERMAAKAITDI